MAFADNTTGGRVIIAGFPEHALKITLTDTCNAGDLIGYASGWKRADTNSSPKVYPELVAAEKCTASGNEIQCYRCAVIDFGSSCTATAGDRVFASNTAGAYEGTTCPNDQGVCVGVMNSTQQAFVNPTYAFGNLKLPNVEYSATSGHVIMVQLKSALAATGTTSLTGIEVTPKVLDAIAAGTISGVKIAIDLEGTSAGTVTLSQGLEINLGSDSGTSRTVTSSYHIRCINNYHGTITNGVSVLRVDTAGGNVNWGAILDLQSTCSGVWSDTDTGSGDTEAGYFKVLINGNARYVVTYSDAPNA
jgi:hypothetical protein